MWFHDVDLLPSLLYWLKNKPSEYDMNEDDMLAVQILKQQQRAKVRKCKWESLKPLNMKPEHKMWISLDASKNIHILFLESKLS